VRFAVVDLDIERSARTVESIVAHGGRAEAFECDVTDIAAITDLEKQIRERIGPIDVLVNNAGGLREPAPLLETTADQWNWTLNVNLTAAFYMCKAFVPQLIERSGGAIVSISSRAVFGNPGQAAYASAKAGISTLAATLAIELGGHNIRSNAVGPGFIATQMTDAVAARTNKTSEEVHASVAEITPLGRVGRPEEIASVVAFLASDDASYISGQTVFVNGGALVSPSVSRDSGVLPPDVTNAFSGN
jgi:3-oxoacyl-[acyl-carrier protein] reductase